MLSFFAKKPAASQAVDLEQAFADRFAGRTLILHAGLSPGWVDELLKEGGGGAHFRIDVRRRPVGAPTPVEWVVQQHILPLACPLPVLIKVERGCLRLRHLTRSGIPVHPSEIIWMLEELPQRAHWALHIGGGGWHAERGIALADNRIQFSRLEDEGRPC